MAPVQEGRKRLLPSVRARRAGRVKADNHAPREEKQTARAFSGEPLLTARRRGVAPRPHRQTRHTENQTRTPKLNITRKVISVMCHCASGASDGASWAMVPLSRCFRKVFVVVDRFRHLGQTRDRPRWKHSCTREVFAYFISPGRFMFTEHCPEVTFV